MPMTPPGSRSYSPSSRSVPRSVTLAPVEPQLTPRDMIKISFCMRRLPHLSREEFLAYWRDKHPAAVPEDSITALGIKRYIQVHTLDTPARKLVVGPRTTMDEELDGIAELWVESLEALERDWSTDRAREVLAAFFADEQNFIDWSRSTILVSEELVVIP